MNNRVPGHLIKYVPIALQFTGVLLLAVLMIAYFALIQASASVAWDTDYKYLYCLAKESLAHRNPYEVATFFDHAFLAKTPKINLNPPFVGILVAPFGLASYPISFWAFSLQSLILSILSVCLIVRALFKQKTIVIYLISALLACSYFPIFVNIKNGQMGALLFFFTALGWLSYREEKLGLAGFFWGIAFSLKLFAGLFLWMFFLRREWFGLKVFLLTVGGCLLLSCFAFSPTVYLHYWHIFDYIRWYSSSWNASLLGFFSRLFGYHREANIAFINFPRLTPIFYGLSVAALLYSSTWFKKLTIAKNALLYLNSFESREYLSEVATASRDMSVSYIIVAMLLISPLGWIYYFSLLFIPMAVIFYWNQRIYPNQFSINLLLTMVVAFSSAPYLLLKPGQITQNQDIFLQSGIYFYALCLLVILIYKVYFRLKQSVCVGHRFLGLGDPFVSGSLCVVALLPSFLGIFHITYLIMAAK